MQDSSFMEKFIETAVIATYDPVTQPKAKNQMIAAENHKYTSKADLSNYFSPALTILPSGKRKQFYFEDEFTM